MDARCPEPLVIGGGDDEARLEVVAQPREYIGPDAPLGGKQRRGADPAEASGAVRPRQDGKAAGGSLAGRDDDVAGFSDVVVVDRPGMEQDAPYRRIGGHTRHPCHLFAPDDGAWRAGPKGMGRCIERGDARGAHVGADRRSRTRGRGARWLGVGARSEAETEAQQHSHGERGTAPGAPRQPGPSHVPPSDPQAGSAAQETTARTRPGPVSIHGRCVSIRDRSTWGTDWSRRM